MQPPHNECANACTDSHADSSNTVCSTANVGVDELTLTCLVFLTLHSISLQTVFKRHLLARPTSAIAFDSHCAKDATSGVTRRRSAVSLRIARASVGRCRAWELVSLLVIHAASCLPVDQMTRHSTTQCTL